MKTQTTIRVDQENYLQAKEILKYLGLTYSQAINVFNNMIVCHKGLPFELKMPDDETLAAMSEAKNLVGDFVSIDEFAKSLDEIIPDQNLQKGLSKAENDG